MINKRASYVKEPSLTSLLISDFYKVMLRSVLNIEIGLNLVVEDENESATGSSDDV